MCKHIHILLKANTRWQEQAGDQHRDGLAISCGHAAQYMATIGAINGSGSNVDLKLYVFHGFSSQDKGQPGCIIPGSGAAAQATMHYKLRGAIGKKKFFFNWLAFTHFWSNFDEIFCAGVKP